MELSVIDKKLAMDSRDIAKQKLFNLLAETSDEDFAKNLWNYATKFLHLKIHLVLYI